MRTMGEGLLDEVGEDDGGAVIREAFDKFNKRDDWSGQQGKVRGDDSRLARTYGMHSRVWCL